MKRRNSSPKTTSSDPRIVEARRLRAKGVSDQELISLGFTPREVSRAFMPNSLLNHKRCSCGAFAQLNEDGICLACVLKKGKPR